MSKLSMIHLLLLIAGKTYTQADIFKEKFSPLLLFLWYSNWRFALYDVKFIELRKLLTSLQHLTHESKRKRWTLFYVLPGAIKSNTKW